MLRQKILSDLFESIWQVMSVTGEFISIAVIYVGTVVFFAWVFVTIFDDMEEMVHGTPVNLGLDSFSRPEGPLFFGRLIQATKIKLLCKGKPEQTILWSKL